MLIAPGVRVDCLSIKQDDVEDKTVLISNMNAIYQRSALTIISAAGAGLDASLPGISARLASDVLPEAMETILTKKGPITLALIAYGASSLLEQSIWVNTSCNAYTDNPETD
jgi:hypothetical protein